MRTGYIYALLDPRSGDVRYVGQTTRDPFLRFQEHLDGGIGCDPSYATRKERWIGQLWRLGLLPALVVLEEVPVTQLDASEKRLQHWYARCQRMTVEGRGFLIPDHGRPAPVWVKGY